jgi:RNA polymerase sigma factor (sigma-70 family)
MGYYGNEMNDFKYVKITPEYEARLFRTFYRFKGKKYHETIEEQIKRGVKNEDLEPPPAVEMKALAARDELISVHLLLVVKLSVRAARGQIPEDMAISAGNLVLMQLLENRRFDPARGKRFSTFLDKHIRFRIRSEVEKFKQHEGRYRFELVEASKDPDEFDITDANDPSRKMQREESVEPEVDSRLFHADLRDKFNIALKWLTPAERAAIVGVGLGGKKFRQVGRELHTSRQSVQQAYWRAIPKIKHIFSYSFNKDLIPQHYENSYRKRHPFCTYKKHRAAVAKKKSGSKSYPIS